LFKRLIFAAETPHFSQLTTEDKANNMRWWCSQSVQDYLIMDVCPASHKATSIIVVITAYPPFVSLALSQQSLR
jgi:hypothetical protein